MLLCPDLSTQSKVHSLSSYLSDKIDLSIHYCMCSLFILILLLRQCGPFLTLIKLMKYSITFDTMNLGWLIIYIKGSQVKISNLRCT